MQARMPDDTFGLEYGVGHLAYIPTNKRHGSGWYAYAGECVMGNEDYIFSVILLTPQDSLDRYLYASHAMLSHSEGCVLWHDKEAPGVADAMIKDGLFL